MQLDKEGKILWVPKAAQINYNDFEVSVSDGYGTDIQSGKILRLRGKGLKSINSHGSGDLLVHVNVWTPKTLSKDQKSFFCRTN